MPSSVASAGSLLNREQEPKIDDTPDGEVHRYIVRCSSIYWCTRKDIFKILSKLEGMPPYGGLHKITKWDHFFITFPNKTCEEKGLCCLNATCYRGVRWEVSPTAEHSAKKMRIAEATAGSKGSDVTGIPESVSKTAADVTAKWRNLPYEEQIRRKKNKWITALGRVSKEMRKELKGKDSLPWLSELFSDRRPRNSPVCCPLVQVISADSKQERFFYRNKNEFTVGVSPDSCRTDDDYHNSAITVGYALGLVRNGRVFVGPVNEDCVTTSETARHVAACLAPVINGLELPPYDKQTHEGYWRQITCREGTRTGQVIVSVLVNPSALESVPAANSRISDEDCQTAVVTALRNHFDDKREFGVFWQPSSHVSAISSDVPPIYLYGIKSLSEEMCGLRFRIQPTAFFQVNTAMAEKLYNLIGEIAEVNKDTVVFDVCCGTGTIGLSLARRAHSVVGIDVSVAAIADAKYNAAFNGVKNATFIAGKVENKIHEAIQKVDGDRECVVVLDPPRAGLPMNVVAAIRAMKAVRRIVYVACEPNNFWRNALGFLRPKSKAFKLKPFHPVKAYGLDLFPHTDHGELAVLLERHASEGPDETDYK